MWALPIEMRHSHYRKSAVGFFVNRLHEIGFIRYDGRIQVRSSLLDVILHDRLPGNNAEMPEIVAAAG